MGSIWIVQSIILKVQDPDTDSHDTNQNTGSKVIWRVLPSCFFVLVIGGDQIEDGERAGRYPSRGARCLRELLDLDVAISIIPSAPDESFRP